MSRNSFSDEETPPSPLPSKLSSLISQIRPYRLSQAWQESAGPVLLREAHFQGLKFRKGKNTLVLTVNDPLWRQELAYQKELILEKFNEALKRFGFSERDFAKACEILAREY